MTRRLVDAWYIQQGACNPSGVARSLVQAIDDARADCDDVASVCADPAVRLICHQLAFLLRTAEYDHSLDAYDRDMMLATAAYEASRNAAA